jgi:hypothetical protein
LFWGNPTIQDLIKVRTLGYDMQYSVFKEILVSDSNIDTVMKRTVSWIKAYDLYETTVNFFEESDSSLVFNFKNKTPYVSTYQSIPRFIEIKLQQLGDNVKVNVRQYPAVKWDQFDVKLAEVYWVNFIKELLKVIGKGNDIFQQDALLSERDKKLLEEEFKKHPKKLLKKAMEIPIALFIVIVPIGAAGIYLVRGSWEPVFEVMYWCFGLFLLLEIVFLIIWYFQIHKK